jgi:hypothetical protein
MSIRRILSWTSRCSRVLPGPDRPFSRLPSSEPGDGRCSGHTLLRFLAPTAHEVTGSDLRRAYLARLCSAFRLSRPLDALLPPKPCRFCFAPAALMGFALQRVSLPNCRDASRHPLPLLTLLSTLTPKRGGPSLIRSRVAAWCPLPLRGVGSAPRARAQAVSGASSGGSARFGSPYSGRRGLAVDGSRSSHGFHPSRGFPLPASTRPMPRLPSCAFSSACRNKLAPALQGLESSEVGLSLSRLPPLMGSLSSSRVLLTEASRPGVGRDVDLPRRDGLLLLIGGGLHSFPMVPI